MNDNQLNIVYLDRLLKLFPDEVWDWGEADPTAVWAVTKEERVGKRRLFVAQYATREELHLAVVARTVAPQLLRDYLDLLKATYDLSSALTAWQNDLVRDDNNSLPQEISQPHDKVRKLIQGRKVRK